MISVFSWQSSSLSFIQKNKNKKHQQARWAERNYVESNMGGESIAKLWVFKEFRKCFHFDSYYN